MIYYLYDGSFSGFLTAIYKAFYSNKEPDSIIKKSVYKPRLFGEVWEIETDENNADKVAKAIKRKISRQSYKNIYYSFLSEQEKIEIEIYYYLKMAFEKGKKIDKNWANDQVRKIKKTSRKVGRERHKYLGLLRFRELEQEVLYAPFEPTYNLLPIISSHFASRIKNSRWVIHDKKRELAVVYDKNEWVMIEGEELPKINYTNREHYYQNLWKDFFENISIENRRNLKRQANFMPKKYWKYLIEK